MVLKLDTMIFIRHGTPLKSVPGDHIKRSAVNANSYANGLEAVPPAVVRRNTLIRHYCTGKLRKPILDALQWSKHTPLFVAIPGRPQE
ncbi:hypothetical protein [Bradyrhizobium yuanmingense]|uniref:hypothetical protein n=1 Tax=Bradyrhizobium yuanmingense TaxID=108015 RepID=UPI0023B9A76E|nr:hypothetical protein [Bradyrhizobium yuanmingense]MDF0497340.1 hypothetical protein [Bradyrhizobium yuanmingense]